MFWSTQSFHSPAAFSEDGRRPPAVNARGMHTWTKTMTPPFSLFFRTNAHDHLSFSCFRWVYRRCRSRAAVPSKTYTAVLEGRMAKTPKSGEVTAKLRPDTDNRPKQVNNIHTRETRSMRLENDLPNPLSPYGIEDTPTEYSRQQLVAQRTTRCSATFFHFLGGIHTKYIASRRPMSSTEPEPVHS